jgi:hypothetical protein
MPHLLLFCRLCGLVEGGKFWVDRMINEFNIQPSEKHYVCIVDLLVRSGRCNTLIATLFLPHLSSGGVGVSPSLKKSLFWPCGRSQ